MEGNPFGDAPVPAAKEYDPFEADFGDAPVSTKTQPVVNQWKTVHVGGNEDDWDKDPSSPIVKVHDTSGGGGGGKQAATRGGGTFGSSSSSSSSSSKGGGGGDDWERADKLDERERMLKEREEQLAAREKKLRDSGVLRYEDNWPCKCYPLAYHDIKGDIPVPYQSLIRMLYVNMLLLWLAVVWNFITMTYIWYVSSDASVGDWMFSVIYVLFGTTGSWKLWYMPLYKACRDRSGGGWCVFFIGFGAHVLFVGAGIVGYSSTSQNGTLRMLSLFKDGQDKSDMAGMFCMAGVALWTILFFFSTYLYKNAHSLWRSGGGEALLRKEVAKQGFKHAVASP